MAKSLEELELAFQIVSNTWRVNCVAKKASLLQAGGTGLGREYQRWLSRDLELRDAVGRYDPCVNGKASSSSLMKKDGEHPWASMTHLNV